VPAQPEPKAVEAPAAPTETDTAIAADPPPAAPPKPKTKPADDTSA
jgi:hypothetical protein